MAIKLRTHSWHFSLETAFGTAHSIPEVLPQPKNSDICLKSVRNNLAAHCSVSLGTEQLVCKQHQIHQGTKGLQYPPAPCRLLGQSRKIYISTYSREESALPGWCGSQCFTHVKARNGQDWLDSFLIPPLIPDLRNCCPGLVKKLPSWCFAIENCVFLLGEKKPN